MTVAADTWTAAWLWLAVLASGVYHGVNPGMGWPLAVSAGLMARRSGALFQALVPLAAGHLLAMLAVLLPFAALSVVYLWRYQIQLGAGLLLVGFGAVLLFVRRHPRAMARLGPARLGLWSFAVATAHGAGLMLVPVYLGLCRNADRHAGERAAADLIGGDLGIAILVAVAHALAMIVAGGAMAWLAYRHLGLKLIGRSWFRLDTLWAASLMLVGAVSLLLTVAARH